MKTSYVKPVVFDLSDSINTAKGNSCKLGSIADTEEGCLAGSAYNANRKACTLGHIATGGTCFDGQAVVGCVVGVLVHTFCVPGGTVL